MRYVTAVLTFFAVKLTARLHVKALCALCTVFASGCPSQYIIKCDADV